MRDSTSRRYSSGSPREGESGGSSEQTGSAGARPPAFDLTPFRVVYSELFERAWKISFTHFNACVERAQETFSSPRRPPAERRVVAKFCREVVSTAYRRTVVEDHHRNWDEAVLAPMLLSFFSLASLCAAALKSLKLSYDDEWQLDDVHVLRRVDVVVFLMDALSWVLSPVESFAKTFAHRKDYGEPCRELVHQFWNVATQGEVSWPVAVTACFEFNDGFQILFEVLYMLPFELRLVDQLLRPLKTARGQLQEASCQFHDGESHEVVKPTAVLSRILSAIQDHLDSDQLEELAPPDDAAFDTLSNTIDHLYFILPRFEESLAAWMMVNRVHIRFLHKLHDRRSFNAMLTLVREMNSLLQRAVRLAPGKEKTARLGPLLTWLRERNVVAKLLSVNMHQRQYVDYMQQFLIALAELDQLDLEIMNALVCTMRKDGVMDVVKDNIARLMKKLLRVVNEELLTAVISQFSLESITTGSDVRVVFPLLLAVCHNTRLSAPDRVRHECLDFGWNLLTSPHHSAFVIKRGEGNGNLFVWLLYSVETSRSQGESQLVQLTDVRLQGGGAADGTGSPGGQFLTRYIQKALGYVQKGQALAPVLDTLRQMLYSLAAQGEPDSPMPRVEVSPKLQQMLESQEMLELVVRSVQRWVTSADGTTADAAEFQPILRHFLDVVISILECQKKLEPSNEQMSMAAREDLVQVLWVSTVGCIPATPELGDTVDYALWTFARLCSMGAIRPAGMLPLITNKAAQRAPGSLSAKGLSSLFSIMVHVNVHFKNLYYYKSLLGPRALGVPNGAEGGVVGMEYVFDVLVCAEDEGVAEEAIAILTQVYIKPYVDFDRSDGSWVAFTQDVTARLMASAKRLAGVPTRSTMDAAAWEHLIRHSPTPAPGQPPPAGAERVCAKRLLRLVTHMLNTSYGSHTPRARPHAAAAMGDSVEVMCQVASRLMVFAWTFSSNRMFQSVCDDTHKFVQIYAHSRTYIGDIRAFIAAGLGVSLGQVQLRMAAAELQDCLQLGSYTPLDSPKVTLTAFIAAAEEAREACELTDLPAATREAVDASAPSVVLLQQQALVPMLLYLLDRPSGTLDVAEAAHEVLGALPTWGVVQEGLVAACDAQLAAEETAQRLAQLLYMSGRTAGQQAAGGEAVSKCPGALLYMLEALYAHLVPAVGPAAGGTALCQAPRAAIDTVINAVTAHFDAGLKDGAFWTRYFGTTFRILQWVTSATAWPTRAMDSTELSQTSGVSAQVSGAVEQEDADTATHEPADAAEAAPAAAGEPQTGAAGGPAAAVAAAAAPQSPTESMGSSQRTKGATAACKPELDVAAVQQLLAFWVHVAVQLAQLPPEPPLQLQQGLWHHRGPGGRLAMPVPLAGQFALSQQKLMGDVLRVMCDLLKEQNDEALQHFMEACGRHDLIRTLLLHPSDPLVRSYAKSLLMDSLLASRHEEAQTWLLEALVQLQDVAHRQPAASLQYHQLLAATVRNLSEFLPPGSRAWDVLITLLTSTLAELHRSTYRATATDQRLQGLLILLASIWQLLVDHQAVLAADVVKVMNDEANLMLLLHGLLFPEAPHVAAIRAHSGGYVASVPSTDLQEVLEPRCGSMASRAAAYEMLRALLAGSTRLTLKCFEHLISMLSPGPKSMDILNQQHQEHHLLDATTSGLFRTESEASRWRGLKNAGATCYMNSIFQQLFMQPTIRALVLRSPEVPADQVEESVFAQVQNMFAHLAVSTATYFTPHGVWKALKDYDGEPINVLEHQDAHEFLQQLQDLVDSHQPGCSAGPKPMSAAMGGSFVQSIRCRHIDYESRRTEDFYQISVDVQNMHSLDRALDVFFQDELMEGDNAYFCDKVGAKVPAIKRTLLSKLPHTFVVHLKRFEFDFRSGTRCKIQDRFDFPIALNLKKYTPEGVDAAGGAETREPGAAASGGAGMQAAAAATAQQDEVDAHYQYELKGVVVHSGNAFAGHYYSFIKERGPRGRWLRLDDQTVTEWDVRQLDDACFGGALDAVGHMRPNSAYILFYERAEALEPIRCSAELKLLDAGVSPAGSRPEGEADGSSGDDSRIPAVHGADPGCEGPGEVGAIWPGAADAATGPQRAEAVVLEATAMDSSPPLVSHPLPAADTAGEAGDGSDGPAGGGCAEAQRGSERATAGDGPQPVPHNMPRRLYGQVMEENLWLAHARHLTAPAHVAFVRVLVADNLQLNSSSDCHDGRQPGTHTRDAPITSASTSGAKTMSCDTREVSTAKRAAFQLDADADKERSRPFARAAVVDDPASCRETLAMLLCVRYLLSTLVFLTHIDEDSTSFFLSSLDSGLERGYGTCDVMRALKAALTWAYAPAPQLTYENGLFNADRKVRDMSARAVIMLLPKALAADCVAGEQRHGDGAARESVSNLVLQFLTDMWSQVEATLHSELWTISDAALGVLTQLSRSPVVAPVMARVATPKSPVFVMLDSLLLLFRDNRFSVPRFMNCYWDLVLTIFVPMESGRLAPGTPARSPSAVTDAVNRLPADGAAAAAARAEALQVDDYILRLFRHDKLLDRLLDVFTLGNCTGRINVFKRHWHLPINAWQSRLEGVRAEVVAVAKACCCDILDRMGHEDAQEALERLRAILLYLVVQCRDAHVRERVEAVLFDGLATEEGAGGHGQPGVLVTAMHVYALNAQDAESHAYAAFAMARNLLQTLHHLHTSGDVLVALIDAHGPANSGRLKEVVQHTFNLTHTQPSLQMELQVLHDLWNLL